MRRINIKDTKLKIILFKKYKKRWYESFGMIGIDGNITGY